MVKFENSERNHNKATDRAQKGYLPFCFVSIVVEYLGDEIVDVLVNLLFIFLICEMSGCSLIFGLRLF